MGQRKIKSDLGSFHKEVARQGITYAQAQIRETCEKIGPVRIPAGSDGEVVFRKVSTWNILRKLAGSK